jgi:hypothetical protein
MRTSIYERHTQGGYQPTALPQRITGVGFRKEGILKQAEYHHGKYQDGVMMAAIRDEWLAEFENA